MSVRDRERDIPPFWDGKVPDDLASEKMLPTSGKVIIIDMPRGLLDYVSKLPDYNSASTSTDTD